MSPDVPRFACLFSRFGLHSWRTPCRRPDWLFFGFIALLSMPKPIAAEARTDTWLVHPATAKPFTVPDSPSEWKRERTRIRRTLNQLLGDLPPRPKTPKVTTLSKEDHPTYTLERFEFDNDAGATVPGVLLLPKNPVGKVPAILYCHWHGGEYDKGKVELFENRHTPQAPGPTLVERGYAVIAIDAYCFGERNGRGPGGPAETGSAGELTASKFQLWCGRSLWGMILRDDLMALDYLASRPEIDARRIGATGISMGATRTWWLMALDERIQAGVAVACLTRYQDLIQAQGLRYHGIYYYVPGMLKHFDTEAVIALCAPRALLCMNGDLDLGSPTPGIHKIEAAAQPAWSLLRHSPNFESIVYPGVGHEYTQTMWTRMLDWMDRSLKPGGKP